MSLDVRRLSEALSTYADEVDVSVSELDRKQRELHQRLDQSRRPAAPVWLWRWPRSCCSWQLPWREPCGGAARTPQCLLGSMPLAR